MPLYIFVCDQCYDTPQEQLRAVALPADPVPISMPFVEPFDNDEIDYQTASGPPVIDPTTGIPIPQTTIIIAQNGSPITMQAYGKPVGLTPNAVSPLNGAVHYGTVLPILSVVSNGVDQITVTCSAAHGMATDAQISVQGLSKNLANGFYSVTVTSGTAFTYQTLNIIPAGSLITGSTRIATALVGLPRGYTRIQQV